MKSATSGLDGALRSRERAIEVQEAELRKREADARFLDDSLQKRIAVVIQREVEVLRREEAVELREHEREAADTGWAEAEEDNSKLRQLNEHLVMLTLEAQELRPQRAVEP